MKKIPHLLVLLLFVSTKGSANTEVDRTPEVRTLISIEASRMGYDSALAAQAFDLIIALYKVKGIYLDSTKTGMSHYSVLRRTLRINVRDGTDSITYKVFSELTHAVQFTWRPFYYSGNAFIVFGKTFYKAVFHRDRERYRVKIDSIYNHSLRQCSKLRAAFIAVYLTDAYCVLEDSSYSIEDRYYKFVNFKHEHCDVRSFEHEHPEIEGELWRLYDDLIFLLPHLPPQEVKGWLKMRKRFIHKSLRHRQRLLFL